MKRQSTPEDLSGVRFGILAAISSKRRFKKPSGKSYTVWNCICDCGKQTVASASNLKRGHTSSCGCKKLGPNLTNTTHGFTTGKNPRATYRVWCGMKARCYNKKNHKYKDYGGRGIKVCQRWMGFENFLMDMGEKPSRKVIDRINNDGNYEPGNCRWSTHYESCRNKRSNIRITILGKTMVLTDWSKAFGLKSATVRARIKRGWTVEQALFKEVL